VRHIVLDTETTGFDSGKDKLVEVGAIELIDLSPRSTFHAYINPGIPVPREATDVHSLTDAFLADKPSFAAVASPLKDFLADSPIVAHNAAFDAGFLAAAYAGLQPPSALDNPFIDSLAMARAKHPGSPCSLDALCRRYGISTAHRTKHGALLDAELLAAVYAELVGRQSALDLVGAAAEAASDITLPARPAPLPARLTAAEIAAHAAMMEAIAGRVM
jgi:DNA polymerase-3 subunit epsilon